MRRLTGISLSVSEIRDRLRSGKHVVVWDSHEYPLTMEREDHHAGILRDIRSLIAKGHTVQLKFTPSASDAWEDVNLDWIEGELEAEREYLRQERD